MVRQFLLFMIWAMVAVAAAAQENEDRGLTVSGSVEDSELKEPVIQATVQLFRKRDSTFVGGTVTDLRGTFSVEAPANGIYKLRISSVGYQTIEREVTLRRNQSQDVGHLHSSDVPRDTYAS